jgi:hypothetical protein
MIYEKMGIKYIASKNIDDYEITEYFSPYLHINMENILGKLCGMIEAGKKLSDTTKKLD